MRLVLAAGFLATASAAGAGTDLPLAVPVPQVNPEKAAAAEPAQPAVPVPTPRPDDAEEASPKQEPTRPADPRSGEQASTSLPPAEIECRKRLSALGADFENRPAERDDAVGCAVPYPLLLKRFGSGIDLEPDALVDCSMAEAATSFVQGPVAARARAEFGSELKSVAQASAFVCRPRHNGGKLSEHAFGNALDIAAFTLADGRTVEVEPAPAAAPSAFLDDIRKAACGPFKTVLGPGSDADHERHLHLDLQPRRNGGTFCQ